MATVRRLTPAERRALDEPLQVARQLDQALALVTRLAVCLDCAGAIDVAAAGRRLGMPTARLVDDLSLAMLHGRKAAP